MRSKMRDEKWVQRIYRYFKIKRMVHGFIGLLSCCITHIQSVFFFLFFQKLEQTALYIHSFFLKKLYINYVNYVIRRFN